MLQTVFRNWNILRFFRLFLGLTIIVQAIGLGDWLMAAFGAVFTSMPLFNYGCCGTNGCGVPMENRQTDLTNQEVTYEEVDSK